MALLEITERNCPRCDYIVKKFVAPRDVTYLHCSNCNTYFDLEGFELRATLREISDMSSSHRLEDNFNELAREIKEIKRVIKQKRGNQ